MVERYVAVERLEAIAARALAEGYGRIVPWSDLDPTDPLAGRGRRLLEITPRRGPLWCDEPIAYELHARYSADIRRRPRPFTVIGTARCRRCPNCRKARAVMWQDRAITEFKAWPTTLFGTITMSPQHHYEMDARIEAGRKAPDGQWLRYPVPISSLPLAELFRKRVAVFGEELQLYLKRLRKGDAKRRRPQVRYLLVAEAHDSDATAVEMRGRPHYHLLIHEQEQGSLFLGSPLEALVAGESGEYIRKKYQTRGVWRDGVFLKDNAFARQQWTWGFTKFQFAENEKAAGYLCKYLTKATQDRIRASLHYGDLEYLQHARSSNESLDSSRDVAQIGPSKD